MVTSNSMRPLSNPFNASTTLTSWTTSSTPNDSLPPSFTSSTAVESTYKSPPSPILPYLTAFDSNLTLNSETILQRARNVDFIGSTKKGHPMTPGNSGNELIVCGATNMAP
mmetsp:Transcript_39839/g.59100  ORF Transcript_39839/g.59100 Transcript_39839/m.59100 type:complete len:111 (+) Transcript_39839:261-593(+)